MYIFLSIPSRMDFQMDFKFDGVRLKSIRTCSDFMNSSPKRLSWGHSGHKWVLGDVQSLI